MQRGFDAVPLPLLEAAAIDGASPWQQFWRIGLSVGLPGVLAALTMSFLDAWNALEQPITFLKTPSLWPLSLYLTDTTGDLALTMAAGLFALLPARGSRATRTQTVFPPAFGAAKRPPPRLSWAARRRP